MVTQESPVGSFPPRSPSDSWEELLAVQDGVASRRQWLAWGWSDRRVARRVRDGRWQHLHPGVHLTTGATPTPTHQVWAALLAVDGLVVASHETALWLAGGRAVPPTVHVAVRDGRDVAGPPGVRVHHLPRLDARTVHPSLLPPRTLLEQSVLDVSDRCSDVPAALLVVYEALQQRLTSPQRLSAALAARPRHRHRAALDAVLDDAGAGALSGLERAHLRLCRVHGLPAGTRQRKLAGPTGSRWVDVLHDEGLDSPLVTELDGRRGHELTGERWRDWQRDNADERAGRGHLRYGAGDVFGTPCVVALDTAIALTRRGWAGRARACSRTCPLSGLTPTRSR